MRGVKQISVGLMEANMGVGANFNRLFKSPLKLPFLSATTLMGSSVFYSVWSQAVQTWSSPDMPDIP